MKVTEFSEKTKHDHVPAPWEPLLAEGDFVSYLPTYRGGQYLELFDEMKTEHETVGEMTSYFYDAAKHGGNEAKSMPLLVFLHGATNALAGKICGMHSGCELYASPQYQADMGGGAYLLVPLANEKTDENGNLTDSWSPAYVNALREIVEKVKREHPVSSVIVLGGSSGGYMTWKLTAAAQDLVNACVPISADGIPDAETLKAMDAKGIRMLVCHGRHDELCPFDECVAPREQELLALKNCICYFPEWVCNGDGGVASLNFGFEMGQHCLINQVQANLLFADGTPYDERLPQGVTHWIRSL